NVPAGISKLARGDNLPGRRLAGLARGARDAVGRQRAGIEEAARPGVAQAPIADYVGTVRGASCIAGVPTDIDRKRLAFLQSQDAGQLPAAYDAVGQTVGSDVKRQVVNVAQHEAMGNVEIGRPALGGETAGVLRDCVASIAAGGDAGTVIE